MQTDGCWGCLRGGVKIVVRCVACGAEARQFMNKNSLAQEHGFLSETGVNPSAQQEGRQSSPIFTTPGCRRASACTDCGVTSFQPVTSGAPSVHRRCDLGLRDVPRPAHKAMDALPPATAQGGERPCAVSVGLKIRHPEVSTSGAHSYPRVVKTGDGSRPSSIVKDLHPFGEVNPPTSSREIQTISQS